MRALIFASLLVSYICPVQAQAQTAKFCQSATQKLYRDQFMKIGGIEQWLTVRGERCDNPVILFLHGGPANPLSPYAEAIYAAWQKDFTIVHWDQRGAGQTFIRNPATGRSAVSITQMREDGREVVRFVQESRGKAKIILMGGSWGSVLGIHMVKAQPELFDAYIGTSQLVSYQLNPSASYQKTLQVAQAANDQSSVKALQEIGAPPWKNPRSYGILRRITKTYEAKTTTPAPKHWWMPAAFYDNAEVQQQYEAAEDYSFMQFIGMKNDGMYSAVDLPKLGTQFKLPVFFVQGEEDLVTLPKVSKGYYDSIQAPKKDYVLVPKAGHNPNQASLDAEWKILTEQVLPMLAKKQ